MAPHLFQCSKLSNSLYKADFLRLQCHSEVKYIILVIRSDVQLEFNVFEIYLTLIAWHHIYFNAQSCRILYTRQICMCFSVRCCGRLRISTARSEFIVCEHQSNYGTQEYLASQFYKSKILQFRNSGQVEIQRSPLFDQYVSFGQRNVIAFRFVTYYLLKSYCISFFY